MIEIQTRITGTLYALFEGIQKIRRWQGQNGVLLPGGGERIQKTDKL